jgi:L-amino acid N-acyltransferase YncA
VSVRPAEPRDLDRIAAIYNEGMDSGEATFETRHRAGADLAWQLSSPKHTLIVAERDGEVVGWAGLAPYSDREAYAGIAELGVYVAESARRSGVGRELIEGLSDLGARRGQYKIVGKIFSTNAASLALHRACGFRDVGVHVRHGRVAGEWRDVVVVELLL